MDSTNQITLNTKLQKLSDKNPEKTHEFFKNTRVESCAYVKMNGTNPQAVPCYYKQKLSVADAAEKSTYTTSIAAETYKVRPNLHLGMDTKPLESYNPISYRNRLPVQDANIAARNTSQIVLGDRGQRNPKMYVTVSKNTIGNFGKVDPVTNTGILSERAKYHHKQQAK